MDTIGALVGFAERTNPRKWRSHTDSIGTTGGHVHRNNSFFSPATVVDATHPGASFRKPLNPREQKIDPNGALVGSAEPTNPRKRRSHTDSIGTTGGHVFRKNP